MTETLQDLKARLDARDVATALIGPGKRSGRSVRYSGDQIGTGGDNPTRYSVTERGFYDFRDDIGGDVVQLVALIKGTSYAEAGKLLIDHYTGSSAPITRRPSPAPETAASEPPPADWQRAAVEAVKAAEQYLWSDREDARLVRAYLHDVRGLTDDTIRAAHLGYNPSWRPLPCKNADGKPISLPPGIVIPYFEGGALWAVRVRSRVGNLADALGIRPDHTHDGDELAKYLNLAGSKVNGPIYNGDALRPGSDVLIVEGELDTDLGQQELSDAVTVVTLGPASSRLTKRGRDLLKDAGRIYLALDNDAAGQKAAGRLLKDFPAATVLDLPAGKDITDYVTKHGGDLAAWWQGRQFSTPVENSCASARIADDRPVLENSPKREPAPDRAEYFYQQGFAVEQFKLLFAAYPRHKNMPHLVLLLYTALARGLIGLEFTNSDLQAARDTLGVPVNDDAILRFTRDFGELFASRIIDQETTMIPGANNTPVGAPCHRFRLLPRAQVERNLLARVQYRLREHRHIERGTAPNLTPEMTGTLDGDARRVAEQIAPTLPPEDRDTRKSKWLAQRDFDELLAALRSPHFVDIPTDCEDVRAAVFAADTPENQPVSRNQIARQFGISRRNVQKLTAHAGRQAVEQVAHFPITSAVELPQQVAAARKAKRGYPIKLIEVLPGGETREHDYQSYDEAGNQLVVENALKAGNTVDLRLRCASVYRKVEPDEEPQPLFTPKPHASRPAKLDHRIKLRPYFGVGYSPDVVLMWLETHLRRLNWYESEDGYFIEPDTGEKFALSGQVERVEARVLQPDPLIETGQALGAEVRVLA